MPEGRRDWGWLTLTLVASDLGAVLLAFWLAAALVWRTGVGINGGNDSDWLVLVMLPVLGVIFFAQGLYEPANLLVGAREFAGVFRASSYGLLAITVITFVLRWPLSRSWTVASWALMTGLVISLRHPADRRRAPAARPPDGARRHRRCRRGQHRPRRAGQPAGQRDAGGWHSRRLHPDRHTTARRAARGRAVVVTDGDDQPPAGARCDHRPAGAALGNAAGTHPGLGHPGQRVAGASVGRLLRHADRRRALQRAESRSAADAAQGAAVSGRARRQSRPRSGVGDRPAPRAVAGVAADGGLAAAPRRAVAPRPPAGPGRPGCQLRPPQLPLLGPLCLQPAGEAARAAERLAWPAEPGRSPPAHRG